MGNLTGSVQNTINDVTSTVGSGTSSTSPAGRLSPCRARSVRAYNRASSRRPRRARSVRAGNRASSRRPARIARITGRSTGTGSGVVAAVPDVVATVPNVVASVSDVVASVPNVVASVPDVVAWVPDVVASVPNVVAPATEVVISVPDTLIASGSEVIAPVQEMTTSVAGAFVPLTQPPSELSSFLWGIAGMDPSAVDGSGVVHDAGLFAAVDASVAPISPLLLPFAGVPGVPLPGTAGVATGSQFRYRPSSRA